MFDAEKKAEIRQLALLNADGKENMQTIIKIKLTKSYMYRKIVYIFLYLFCIAIIY